MNCIEVNRNISRLEKWNYTVSKYLDKQIITWIGFDGISTNASEACCCISAISTKRNIDRTILALIVAAIKNIRTVHTS